MNLKFCFQANFIGKQAVNIHEAEAKIAELLGHHKPKNQCKIRIEPQSLFSLRNTNYQNPDSETPIHIVFFTKQKNYLKQFGNVIEDLIAKSITNFIICYKSDPSSHPTGV